MHFDILPTTSEQIPNSTIASERESATPPYLPSRSCRKNGGTRVQLLTDFFTENRLVAQSIRVSSARPSDSFLRQLSKLSLFSPSLCFSSRGPTYLPTWIHTFKMRERHQSPNFLELHAARRPFWAFALWLLEFMRAAKGMQPLAAFASRMLPSITDFEGASRNCECFLFRVFNGYRRTNETLNSARERRCLGEKMLGIVNERLPNFLYTLRVFSCHVTVY